MYRQNAFVKTLSKTGRSLGTRKDNPSIVDFGNNNNAIRNQKHFKPVANGNDCNWTRTQNHLARKRTLNHMAKLAKGLCCVLSTYLYGAFDCMFFSCHVRVSE